MRALPPLRSRGRVDAKHAALDRLPQPGRLVVEAVIFGTAAVALYYAGQPSLAAVFGLMISVIACYEGLHVTGGAEGVGRATTNTVVKCIVALISADVVFTAVFYAFGL